MTDAPTLCVVGHPNQGKSSLVSTLVENDSVQVGPESGTTRRSETFQFVHNGEVLLTLTDTPGFQRARQFLARLEETAVAPAERPERIRTLMADPTIEERFADECEILAPIMAGSGLLYVVDAAHPVSAADLAEMEILRWTGRPRMAVINPVAEAGPALRDEWERTLGQYFQWVRVFNPVTATLPARQRLLRAMGELTPAWQRPVDRLIESLRERDEQRLREAAAWIAGYWIDQMTTRLSLSGLRLPDDDPGSRLARRLEAQERAFLEKVRTAWGHQHLAVAAGPSEFTADEQNLMHTEHWYLWGLSERDLLVVSAAAGAATGAAVDVGLGGMSAMIGTVAGGLAGSAGGWWAGRRWRTGGPRHLGWLPLVREKSWIGPVTHPNFPLVVMARAVTGVQQIWLRPHARRDALALEVRARDWPRTDQVRLLRWSRRLQKQFGGSSAWAGGAWSARQSQQLESWIQGLLQSELQAVYDNEGTHDVWVSDSERS